MAETPQEAASVLTGSVGVIPVHREGPHAHEAAMVSEQLVQGPTRGPPRACGWVQRLRLAGPWLAMAAALLGSAACLDEGPVIPEEETEPPGIVSNPVQSLSAAPGVTGSAHAVTATGVAYISLPPDSIPNGEIAAIRNARTGNTVTTAMADGGFDPIAVEAGAGDQLELDIQVSGGGPAVRAVFDVPEHRKPRVVRTRPAVKKRDVVLNAVLTIVFSEPVNGQMIDPASVRLLRNGTPVDGRLTVTADGLRAELQPDQLLAPNTDYVLAVTTGVTDLTGEQLEEEVAAEFSTGTTTATAMAYTDPSALYVVNGYPALDGLLRSAEFEAILHDDGRTSGRYSLFFPENGWSSSGRISCFSIAGDTTWVAGVVEETTKADAIGKEVGWVAVDNDGAGAGVADQLSLAWVGLSNWIGTARDFCDAHPTDQVILQDVEAGDIVVQGSTPPPAPAAQLAFTQAPTNSPVGMAVTPAVTVTALNQAGQGASHFRGAVTLAIANNPGGGTVSGITTVVAQAGVATFTDLTITAPGTGYTLAATADGLNGDTSVAFEVVRLDGRLVFVREEERVGAGPEIYTMNADRSGLTRLTNDTFGDGDPAWSPDGGKIAFASARDGGGSEIYVMNADGSSAAKLTNEPNSRGPTWSPDGAKIAFYNHLNTEWSIHRIFLMNADGSAVTRFADEPLTSGDSLVWHYSPSWSPAGNHVAFVRNTFLVDPSLSDYGSRNAIVVVDADGTGARTLSDGADGGSPAWSPDGTTIAFTRHAAGVHCPPGDIYLMNADGTGLEQVTTNAAVSHGDFDRLTWSPDGQWIAFTSWRDGEIIRCDPTSDPDPSTRPAAYDIYAVRTDGTGLTRLTHTGRDRAPLWSPAPQSATLGAGGRR